MSTQNLLFILPGPMPPASESAENAFHFLSKEFQGTVLSTVFTATSEAEKHRYDQACGNFDYRPIRLFRGLPGLIKNFLYVTYFVGAGVFLHFFRKNYDAIISYGYLKTGVAAYLISVLTRQKFILELPGNPNSAFRFHVLPSERPSRLKVWFSRSLGTFLAGRADRIKTLYPGQGSSLKADEAKASCFANFVPISRITPNPVPGIYILFLGHPWYLKGVDILIKAFNQVSGQFPDIPLKIVGHCDEREYYESLCPDTQQIEMENPVSPPEARKLVEGCLFLVLPSRTEAMGRVILEAWAARKAVIGSRIDGIPHYVKDNYNGLLFEPENHEDLAKKLLLLLGDEDMRSQLADQGHADVQNKYSEEAYVRNYKNLIAELNG